MINNILKTSFSNPSLFNEIPREILNDVETLFLNEYNKQSKITEPSLQSIAISILKSAAPPAGFRGLIESISKAETLDVASQQVTLFALNSRAVLKITKQISLLENDKDIKPLLDRLVELQSIKQIQYADPINALNWEALTRAEEEEITLSIPWLADNDVPLKKKVLYSFIATTNGGKTVLKTWLSIQILKAGSNVLYLAQEEPSSDTIRRVYQTALGITEIQYKELTKDGFEEVGKRFVSYSKENNWGQFYVAEWSGIKISTVKAYLNKHTQLHGNEIDAVIIDYGKLVEVDNAKKNQQEWERIGIIFKELKDLAMSSNVCVVTSIQLNRESSKALAERGTTPDLYDVAGAWEATHHVNYVWAVKLEYPVLNGMEEDVDSPYKLKGTYTLTVQKQKYGNLRKGDAMRFDWLADHSLVQRDPPALGDFEL
jgi:hypothetical protein